MNEENLLADKMIEDTVSDLLRGYLRTILSLDVAVFRAIELDTMSVPEMKMEDRERFMRAVSRCALRAVDELIDALAPIDVPAIQDLVEQMRTQRDAGLALVATIDESLS